MTPPALPMIDERTSRSTALVLAGLVALATAGCSTRAIERSAREQSSAGHWVAALATLEDGVRSHPHSTALRAQLLQTREQAVATRVAAALSARDAGRLDVAERELGAVRQIDPRNERVLALLADIATERRQLQALGAAEELLAAKQPAQAHQAIEQALKQNPRHAGLVALNRRIELELHHATQGALGALGAGLAEQRPISLDFRDAPLRLVLDAVTRHSGVNFVFDRDAKADQRVTLLMRQARLDDVLELLTATHQLARKVVDPFTVLIYPNTPEKQREYQEQVVRVFHLASADAKAAAAFLRSMLRIREPFVDERSNLLALRETPQNIQLAERLVALFDTSEPEVLLDLEVLEVSASRLTDLGVKLPDSFSITPLAPGGGQLTLGNAGDINRSRLALGVGGILVNFKREVGDFTTLANPRIRARNREKARVLVGDKIPIVTTTTSGLGGFASESISYLEVGLKLEVEPTVYADDEVAIKMALEVSSVGSAVRTNNGSLAYQIGTRNASTVLRLRDGATQLLAGLISRDERSSASGLPGLIDLPVLGRLFSSQQDQAQRTELILAITPRILRNTRRPSAGESEVWVGTDASPRLRLAMQQAARETADTTAAPAAPAPPMAAGAPGPAAAPAAQPAAAALGSIPLAWQGPAQMAVGEEADVQLLLPAGAPLRGMAVELWLDSAKLQVLRVSEGELFKRDGEDTVFTSSLDAKGGRLRAGSMRKTATAATGPGTLLSLRVKAIAAGAAVIKLDGGQPVVMLPPIPTLAPSQWTVNVR